MPRTLAPAHFVIYDSISESFFSTFFGKIPLDPPWKLDKY